MWGGVRVGGGGGGGGRSEGEKRVDACVCGGGEGAEEGGRGREKHGECQRVGGCGRVGVAE